MAIESQIRARIDAFATELTSLLRDSALEVVQSALGNTSSGGARGARAAKSARPAATSRRSSGHGKGQKRDPKLLDTLTEKLGAYITKNQGQRIEQIGKALGTATRDLVLPIKRLLASKRVSTKGQKRATTYHSGGRGAAKPRASAKKASRKVRAKRRGRRMGSPKARRAGAKRKTTPRAAKQAKRAAPKAAKPATIKPPAPAEKPEPPAAAE